MKTIIELHGKSFNVEKRNGEWQTNYRDAKATTGTSKVDVINQIKAWDKTKLLYACDAMDKTIKRDIYFKEHTNQFTAIFGFTPPKDFLLYAVGNGLCLDVIQLDKKLRTPDGVSTNDYILSNYGQQALDMVKNMI